MTDQRIPYERGQFLVPGTEKTFKKIKFYFSTQSSTHRWCNYVEEKIKLFQLWPQNQFQNFTISVKCRKMCNLSNGSALIYCENAKCIEEIRLNEASLMSRRATIGFE
jgi:hypothetical protein